MRKIGLIGGMSWVSTQTYYRHINEGVRRRRGGLASAPLFLDSLDFAPLSGISSDEQWRNAADVLRASAQRLEAAGATAILICANSMHKVYDEVADAVSVPILHIADCVGRKMHEAGVKRAALIGTRNVMTESFYRQRLVSHGISLLPPNLERVEEIDRIIYQELMLGEARRDSERTLKTFLADISKEGADAVVLACTELEMIVNTGANVLPIYDGTRIHAEAAVQWILDD